MYISIDKKGYATLANSSRDGKKTSIEYSEYLGKVIDKEKGIFKSRERGYFTYNLLLNEYGPVPDDFVPPPTTDARKRIPKCLEFGDSFLIDTLLWKSGFWDVVDTVPWRNKDTLHAMAIFYIVSLLPNCDAEIWYANNIISKLYPNARMDSQGISEFLEKIGDPESMAVFQEEYIKFVLDSYSSDTNVLIDSMGVPNKGKIIVTRTNIHNGKVSLEARIVIVAQKSTGIQMYFQLVPGNVNDSVSLIRVLEHCKELGLNISECLLDAGYCTDVNLDEFYDEDHTCIIRYITRPKCTAKYYTEALPKLLPTLESKENFVSYGDRYLFIACTEVMVGKKNNQPAFLYVGLDTGRMSDELHKLLKRAKKDKMPIEKVYEAIENQGIFSLLSGHKLPVEDILPEYYVRQEIEQLNDVAKNYTKLLPTRCHSNETFAGHVFLSMIALAVVRFIQIQLNDSELFLGSRFAALRVQKVFMYKTSAVTDAPMKPANDVYKAFKIKSPVKIKLDDGKLQFTRPKKEKNVFKPPKPKQKAKQKLTNAANEPSANQKSESDATNTPL